MKIGHHSSLYSATPDQFRKVADSVVGKCTLATFTEVHENDAAKAGRDRFTHHGWDTWQPPPGEPVGSDENALAWDLDIWKMEDHAKKKLSDIRYTREGGALAPYTVAIAGLFKRISNGDRWIVVVTHMPANTTDGGCGNVHWNDAGNGKRGDQFRQSMKHLGPWVQDIRQKWGRGGAATLIAGDWNQKCECDWFRNRVLDWMPGEFKVAGGPYPNTIGDSTYDWWIRGNHITAAGDAVTFDTPGSDHRFVVRNWNRVQ